MLAPIPGFVFFADARTLFERGMVQHKTGDLAAAEESLRAASEVEPNNFAIAGNLGVVLAQQGKYAAAIHHYRRALALNPQAHRLWLNLGIASFKQGFFTDAISELEQFRESDPNNAQAQELLALSYLQVQRSADSITLLTKLISSKGEKLPYLYALGQAQIRSGDNQAGERTLRRMFSLFPDSPETHMLRAQASMTDNEFELAFSELAIAEKSNPSLPGLELWKGIALEGLARPEEARAAYKREIARTRDPLAYYAAGILEWKLGTPEAAVDLLKLSLPIDSETYNVSYYLARAYLKLKRFDEALQFVTRSLSRNPESIPDHMTLLSVYRELGRTAEVKKEAATIRKLQNSSMKKHRDTVDKQ